LLNIVIPAGMTFDLYFVRYCHPRECGDPVV
jgi:hypothetical protein